MSLTLEEFQAQIKRLSIKHDFDVLELAGFYVTTETALNMMIGSLGKTAGRYTRILDYSIRAHLAARDLDFDAFQSAVDDVRRANTTLSFIAGLPH